MVTTQELLAATDAVGWEPPVHDVKVALEKWADTSLADMRKTLSRSVQRFEDAGGRGVTLADEIDMLRIAVAVRELREHG
jgi:hypothetical protein